MKLVNIGCGEVFHPAWVNLDVAPVASGVRRFDARRPLPLADGEADAVYHSHLLEHLQPPAAAGLLGECRRILRSGGVVRVVVPDLAGIARAYLDALSDAEAGGDATLHQWCRMELTDQLARWESGGEMAKWLARLPSERLRIVRTRAGGEVDGMLAMNGGSRRWRTITVGAALRKIHLGFLRALVRVLGGPGVSRAFDEGLFRARGEVHRVMYDERSLRLLLESAGFVRARRVSAEESDIPEFASYQLDMARGEVRKPDSLFMEAIRP